LDQSVLQIEPEAVCGEIEKFIKEKVSELNRKGVILGLSGGVDSSVVACLASRAVGPKNVLCLILPEKHSSTESQSHARLVADMLGTYSHVEDLTPRLSTFGVYRLIPSKTPGALVRKAFEHYTKKSGTPPFSDGSSGPKSEFIAKANAFYRIKHRMRTLTLYYHAELKNLLVAGAANKTEFLIGFFVKHGCDDAADIMPILGLYKTQVRQLAEYLNIPKEIIDKPPSPDLIPGITDEYAIGLPYETLDLILHGLERSLPREEIADQIGCEQGTIEYVDRLVDRSKYKREMPYIPDLMMAGK
jgi:NAD+ synthase